MDSSAHRGIGHFSGTRLKSGTGKGAPGWAPAIIEKMGKSEIKHPDKRVDTGAYSAAVEVDGWVFVSGQVPIDMKTGETIEGDVAVQTRATLEHIRRILEEAGCGVNDVVKSTCHLARIQDFTRFNEVYATFFDGVRPARTTVQSVLGGGTLTGEILVEIDVVARKSPLSD